MPLVYQQYINENTQIGVWHIIEQDDFFLLPVSLPLTIHHPHKRLQHLAGRYLLKVLFPDFPIELIRIADARKPFLTGDPFHFSISHSGDYAAVIVSRTNRVGVDIELPSLKIEKLKTKFLSVEELKIIMNLAPGVSSPYYLQMLTLAWGIKETMFKWYGAGGVDFKAHLQIRSIVVEDNLYEAECMLLKNENIRLQVYGLFINEGYLTWTLT